MAIADVVCVGVECASGRKTFTYVALDRNLRMVAIADAEIEDLTLFLRGQASATVAVNSPAHLSQGIIRRRLERDGGGNRSLRGMGIREAEYELRARGIAVNPTPASAVLCAPWVQSGFALYQTLNAIGFETYPDEQAPLQWLESHPHAAFCALLGGIPLPKPTLEGRLQRALILYERGVGIQDPMSFLEEITRHRVLHGTLPLELLPLPAQLDAVVAAYTAWLVAAKPAQVTRLGNREEGFVTLPAAELKQKY